METIVEPVEKTTKKKVEKDDVYSETFLKLLEKVESLEKDKKEREDNQVKKDDVPNEVLEIVEPPRKIVFQIKGIIFEDAMKDGAYIAGRAFGISKHKTICELLNINEEIFEPSLNRWKTGFEVDDIIYSNLPEEQKQLLITEVNKARKWIEYKQRVSLNDTNSSFWGKRRIEITDLGKVYDTSKDINNLIMYYNIIGGGYPEIAKSYDHAKALGQKLYLTVYEEEAKRQMAGDKLIFKAFGKLEDLDNNWSVDDCLYLLYSLSHKKEHGFTLSTPKDLILNQLHSFVVGENEQDKKQKPKEFLDALSIMSSDPQYVKTKALFNAALYYGFIVSTKERTYVNKQTGFNYGSSDRTAIEKLLDPKNIEELGYINAKIKDKWTK